MGDHLVLSVDPVLIAPASLQTPHGAEAQGSLIEGAIHCNDVGECDTLEEQEEEHLIQTVECRICLEEDSLQNLDIPCACSGTMKGLSLFQNLKLMALLLLRHAAPLFNADVEKALTYFSFFFLRATAVILPCYLMVQIIRIIQHQRQRQTSSCKTCIYATGRATARLTVCNITRTCFSLISSKKYCGIHHQLQEF